MSPRAKGAGQAGFEFVCPRCATTVAAGVAAITCACGAPLAPVLPPFDPAALRLDDRSVWRYGAFLPVVTDKRHPAITLGEGGTPLLEIALVGMPIQAKLEFLQPTGSYKDRGAAVLATALAAGGSRAVVEDSSGNAGAAMAAYLSRAGIGLQLFVPQTTTSGALHQAEVYGADVDRSAANRTEAATKAMGAVSKTQGYASHVYSPYFIAGVATLAYELWEDLGRVPDNVVVPVGQGVLALGLYYGFRNLKASGHAKKVPRFYGVQARACAPIYDAFNRGAAEVPPAVPRPTSAQGVAVAAPPRGAEVVAAFRETDGALVSVSEVEITRAQSLLARAGWFVEATGAVAVAGLMKLDKRLGAKEVTVVPLTGAGLKG